MSIFEVKDLDNILLQFLSIDDLRALCQINKYYNQLIRIRLQGYYDFFNIVDTIKIPNYFGNNKVFMKAIQIGNLNVCKYLFNKNKYDIHASNEFAFQLGCEKGHLHIAQWFFSFGNVDIHTDTDWAFRWSCSNGHLNVAKWLFSLGKIDIHAKNCYAFQNSCLNGHLNVAQWLCTLYPRYSIQVINGKIKYTIN